MNGTASSQAKSEGNFVEAVICEFSPRLHLYSLLFFSPFLPIPPLAEKFDHYTLFHISNGSCVHLLWWVSFCDIWYLCHNVWCELFCRKNQYTVVILMGLQAACLATKGKNRWGACLHSKPSQGMEYWMGQYFMSHGHSSLWHKLNPAVATVQISHLCEPSHWWPPSYGIPSPSRPIQLHIWFVLDGMVKTELFKQAFF